MTSDVVYWPEFSGNIYVITISSQFLFSTIETFDSYTRYFHLIQTNIALSH